MRRGRTAGNSRNRAVSGISYRDSLRVNLMREEEMDGPIPDTAFVGGEVERVWRPDRSDLLGQSTYGDGFVTAQLARLTIDREHDERRIDALTVDVSNLQALAKVQMQTIADLTTALQEHLRRQHGWAA